MQDSSLGGGNSTKAYVDQAVGGAYAAAQRINSALSNRAAASGVVSSATLTAPTAGIVVAAVLVSKASGLFVVGCSGTATAGAVEVGGVTIAMNVVTTVVPGAAIVVANGTPIGTGVQNSSATTALTLSATGGVATALMAAQNGLNNLAASALVMPWGIAGVHPGTSRVALGSQVAFALVGTVATTTLQLSNFNFSIFELP